MDTKEKIKLLADLQSAIDNEELKKTVLALPSGEKIWDNILSSLNKELETLLSGNVKPAEAAAVANLAKLLERMDRSLVVTMLRSIDEKLARAPGTPPAQQTQPVPAPAYPPLETPVDQEELQREWERQQLANSKPRGRSSAAGPF